MNCKYVTRRTQKYEKYWYCRFYRKKVDIRKCCRCNYFETKRYKELKNKSRKLSGLERKRDKGRVKKGICEICGKYSERLDPHEVYGGSNRLRSMKEGMVAMICRGCHDNDVEVEKLKIKYQMLYEENHSREEFIALIGKSYL